jgi:hypothetical protein
MMMRESVNEACRARRRPKSCRTPGTPVTHVPVVKLVRHQLLHLREIRCETQEFRKVFNKASSLISTARNHTKKYSRSKSLKAWQ